MILKNKFIVITTCYNVSPYIEHNITINKFQSYENVLFVYINDNSNDETYNTLKTLTNDDKRFLI